MAAVLENLRKDVRMQKESDQQMSTIWFLVYLLPIIVGLVASAFSIVSLIDFFASIDPTAPYDIAYDNYSLEFASVWMLVALTSLVNIVVNVILTYMLVNRRYTHFKRQKLLSEDIMSAVSWLTKKKEVDVEVGLTVLERTKREADMEEVDKTAILWAILAAFVPFVNLYVYYFLMNDFYRHERREDRFWEDTSKTFEKLGVNFSVPQRTQAMPNRSFVLYLILAVITLGMFYVYWIYTLIKDPNSHFKYHIQVENQLITALEPALDQD